MCKAIVAHLYDRLVYLQRNEPDWKDEQLLEVPWGLGVFLRGRMGSMLQLNLKSFYSYEKKYGITNMALIGHNKRFMFAAVGAPGSTHHSRPQRSCGIYVELENGNILRRMALATQDGGYRLMISAS